MKVNRRSVFMFALTFVGISGRGPVKAQQPFDFNPVSTAKLRAGEITREIEGSPRDQTVPEPSWDAVFNAGLLLQAGLRALLPIRERQGVALPGAPSPKDPPELVEAQENYKAVFQSGAEATRAQKAIALKSLDLAALQLRNAGYASLSKSLSDWIGAQDRRL